MPTRSILSSHAERAFPSWKRSIAHIRSEVRKGRLRCEVKFVHQERMWGLYVRTQLSKRIARRFILTEFLRLMDSIVVLRSDRTFAQASRETPSRALRSITFCREHRRCFVLCVLQARHKSAQNSRPIPLPAISVLNGPRLWIFPGRWARASPRTALACPFSDSAHRPVSLI